ncbi:hypothetical protein AOLI_G00254630 [Acnodon oligacanthus]
MNRSQPLAGTLGSRPGHSWILTELQFALVALVSPGLLLSSRRRDEPLSPITATATGSQLPSQPHRLLSATAGLGNQTRYANNSRPECGEAHHGNNAQALKPASSIR